MMKLKLLPPVGILLALLWAGMVLNPSHGIAAEEEDNDKKNEKQICNTEKVQDSACPSTGKRNVKVCYKNGQKVSSSPQQCVQ